MAVSMLRLVWFDLAVPVDMLVCVSELAVFLFVDTVEAFQIAVRLFGDC